MKNRAFVTRGDHSLTIENLYINQGAKEAVSLAKVPEQVLDHYCMIEQEGDNE